MNAHSMAEGRNPLVRLVFALAAVVIVSLFGACAVTETGSQRPASRAVSGRMGGKAAPDLVSKGARPEPYKVGVPYRIAGVTYYPKEDWDYVEEGVASWYGPGFHGKKTANGEVFNQHSLTAAHKTLPLPSTVRVTNLENGRSIVVRVNDRGPFVGDRLIDLSKQAAKVLGFMVKGTAHVRVENITARGNGMAVAAHTTPSKAVSKPREAERVAMNAGAPVTGASTTQPHPGMWFIQAGAFSNLLNAQALQARLAGLAASSITLVRVNGSSFYRVRLGPFADDGRARKVLELVRDRGVTGARLARADGEQTSFLGRGLS